ncbi:hypothetical protein BWQ96_07426 [Gracilariopsis chorda]|uniref:Uncharacterized protein n=1 Tax=Gracilariopsis chorda TaxID=448386 RepID=A0A2V3IL64_9FLOR|nr:hypothetical protein BWQ96_07426 [Gracilariopsis chorda]|eukprot:PXF42832.1 hypothetical protein BWQ96_07426 [Gracilariopsis chorda]
MHRPLLGPSPPTPSLPPRPALPPRHPFPSRPPLPPRPDSPRLLQNSRFAAQARLKQLVVWRDAAQDTRDLHAPTQLSELPQHTRKRSSTVLQPIDINAFADLGVTHPKNRPPDRIRPSLYSLFQPQCDPQPQSSSFGLISRKSLFSLSKSAVNSARAQQHNKPQQPPSAKRPLFRRRASIHKYMRIVVDPLNHRRHLHQKQQQPDQLDDLMHALQATPVIETALPQPSST